LPPATATQPNPLTEEAMPETTIPLEGLTGVPAASVPPAAEAAVAAAKEDLANWLDVSGEDILVTSIEAVQWSDSSLGCPQPEMMYLQVITPGFRVILQAQGQTYEYHTDQGRNAVLCDGKSMPNRPTLSAPSTSSRESHSPWQRWSDPGRGRLLPILNRLGVPSTIYSRLGTFVRAPSSPAGRLAVLAVLAALAAQAGNGEVTQVGLKAVLLLQERCQRAGRFQLRPGHFAA